MPAVELVQVLSTNRAKPLAGGVMQRADGHLQQSVLAYQGLKIKMRVFRHHQARVGDRPGGKGVQLGEVERDRLAEADQAAHALQVYPRVEPSFDQQALWGAADFGCSGKVVQRQILTDLEALNIEFKIAAGPNRTTNEETNIQQQGFARVGHDVTGLS